MERSGDDRHLSQISTAWTEMFQAHRGNADESGTAQRRLLQRYGTPVYRYLLGALRDPDAADEAFQEFALRFVRGDFQNADPGRGRFRNFLKSTLYRLVIDFHRRRSGRPLTMDVHAADPADPGMAEDEADRQFTEAWRDALFAQSWEALAELESRESQPLHAVLRARTDHPSDSSAELAARLAATLGRAVTPEWVRKRLHQARARFTDLLIDVLARSLDDPTVEAIEQELIDLNLLDYCRPALLRRASG